MCVGFGGEEGWINEEAEEDSKEDGGVDIPFEKAARKMIMDFLPYVGHFGL